MHKQSYVAIIDFGMGNLFSVKRACDFCGLASVITSDKHVVDNACAAILPGVGAFGNAMANLRSFGLVESIKEFVISGKPFMGICLGMQLLLTESEEFGSHKGLDIIRGSVRKFPSGNSDGRIKVPQVGWNTIKRPAANCVTWENTPLSSIKDEEYMYFVHSYYCRPENPAVPVAFTEYEGTEYCSGLLHNNIFAVQFHPEKSAQEGMKIYKNWAQQIGNVIKSIAAF